MERHDMRASGFGPAKDGVHHWWMQRVSAVALVPLTMWFLAQSSRRQRPITQLSSPGCGIPSPIS